MCSLHWNESTKQTRFQFCDVYENFFFWAARTCDNTRLMNKRRHVRNDFRRLTVDLCSVHTVDIRSTVGSGVRRFVRRCVRLWVRVRFSQIEHLIRQKSSNDRTVDRAVLPCKHYVNIMHQRFVDWRRDNDVTRCPSPSPLRIASSDLNRSWVSWSVRLVVPYNVRLVVPLQCLNREHSMRCFRKFSDLF